MSPTTKTEGKVGEQETHRYNYDISSSVNLLESTITV
jgi:hypothetical protein